MPTAAEHGLQVKKLLGFAGSTSPDQIDEMRVTAYFYAALHMIEATAYLLSPYLGLPRHFSNHDERRVYFRTLTFGDAFFLIKSDYGSLQELSERARYLALAGQTTFKPLRPSDAVIARAFFVDIKRTIEGILNSRKVLIPWI